jgi:hypothetical protein
MLKKISIFMVVSLAIICFSVCSSADSVVISEETNIDETSYGYGFVIVETFSTSGSISGIPENEHVGSLHDVNITTNGGCISLFFTSPIWGSAINFRNENVHIEMENFLGVTILYSGNTGCLVGICKNISWELIE